MNLYQEFHLDPADDCTALGLMLSAQEFRLEQLGRPATSPEIKRVQMAYGILSKQNSRDLYDEHLKSQTERSNAELEYLADFGAWPVGRPPSGPSSQPGQSTSGNPYAPSGPWTAPYQSQGQPQQDNPFAPGAQPQVGPQNQQQRAQPQVRSEHVNPYQQATQPQMQSVQPNMAPIAPYAAAHPYQGSPLAGRPTASNRVWMTLFDGLISLVLLGIIMSITGDDRVASAVAMVLVIMAYYLACEVLAGGTPAKLIRGYMVRDVQTGANLSWAQSAKRNWWRLVSAVPGLGQVVSVVAAIVYVNSIKPENQLRGAHDVLANAEVVHKDTPKL